MFTGWKNCDLEISGFLPFKRENEGENWVDMKMHSYQMSFVCVCLSAFEAFYQMQRRQQGLFIQEKGSIILAETTGKVQLCLKCWHEEPRCEWGWERRPRPRGSQLGEVRLAFQWVSLGRELQGEPEAQTPAGCVGRMGARCLWTMCQSMGGHSVPLHEGRTGPLEPYNP